MSGSKFSKVVANLRSNNTIFNLNETPIARKDKPVADNNMNSTRKKIQYNTVQSLEIPRKGKKM